MSTPEIETTQTIETMTFTVSVSNPYFDRRFNHGPKSIGVFPVGTLVIVQTRTTTFGDASSSFRTYRFPGCGSDQDLTEALDEWLEAGHIRPLKREELTPHGAAVIMGIDHESLLDMLWLNDAFDVEALWAVVEEQS